METFIGTIKDQGGMPLVQTTTDRVDMSAAVQAMNGALVGNGHSMGMEETQVPTEPDADTIKMFVGQIPRSWGEEQCRQLFEQFGPVHQLNVLRDKATQASKGCCFVTFYHRKDAIGAQSALHNIKVLPQMHHAVQMKPADSENRNERKLFVGMLNKKLQEADVRQMFVSFGPIEDCTVLKDAEGKSKGCAFVTFATRTCAQNAIKHMHHSQTMEGCSMPLVVKFADTQKEKEAKKGQTIGTGVPPPATAAAAAAAPTGALNAAYLQMLQSQSALGGGNNINNLFGSLGPQLAALSTLLQGGASGTQNVLSLLGNAVQQQQQHQQRMLELSQLMNGGCAAPGMTTSPKGAAPGSTASPNLLMTNSQTNGNLITLTGNGASHPSPAQTHQTALGGIDALQQAYSGIQQYAASFPQVGFAQQSVVSQAAVGKQTEGPEGSNLFIYHLPQEFNDNDLAQTFAAFGNVVSAKVFIDKQTNLSKCFGFVSYDNALSAQQAIQAMNGFQIGTKRLKVQLKRSKSDGKPYQHPAHTAAASAAM